MNRHLRPFGLKLGPLQAGAVYFPLHLLAVGVGFNLFRALRTFPLLDGYRGAPRADVPAVEDVLLRISALAAAHPQIAELDCNPLLASPDGVVVLDARIRVAEPAAPRPYPALDR